MDDVSLLVPEGVDEENSEKDSLDSKLYSEEIVKNFLRLGITQVVFGVITLIGGIIIAASYPYYSADEVAEGIWCGAFITVSGALSITARYHLYSGVVIASFVFNIITAILTPIGVILAAVSFFSHATSRWEFAVFSAFVAMNCSLTACTVLSIYLSLVFGKILNQKKQICCIESQSPLDYGDGRYAMIYVPPTAPTNPQMTGAFMAVPGNAASQPSANPI